MTTAHICDSLEKNHHTVDRATIEAAYALALSSLRDQAQTADEGFRDRLFLYIDAAKHLADLGFGQDAVIAAILCGCPVSADLIRRRFGLVPAMIAAEYAETERRMDRERAFDDAQLESITALMHERAYHYQAFFIYALRLIHAFGEIEVTNDAERLRLADHIALLVLPIVRHEEIDCLKEPLEDICFAAKHRRTHRLIKKGYDEFFLRNRASCERTTALLKKTFIPPAAEPSDAPLDSTGFEELILEQPLPFALYRKICAQDIDVEHELDRFMIKPNVYLCDLILLTDRRAAEGPAVAAFLDRFFPALSGEGFTLSRVTRTDRRGESYFVLRDRMNNRYRLFIRTPYRFARRRLGRIVDRDLCADRAAAFSPDGGLKTRIRIFDPENRPWVIETGTTVLEFAFLMDSRIGCCFKSAEVNGSPVEPYYLLRSGDIVKINVSGEKTVNVKWFLSVRNPFVKELLIRLLSSED